MEVTQISGLTKLQKANRFAILCNFGSFSRSVCGKARRRRLPGEVLVIGTVLELPHDQ
jgi:hypothetical protein